MWKNILAGAAAGFAASIAMTQFQKAMNAAMRSQRNGRNKRNEEAPATVKAAETMAKRFGVRKLSDDQKKAAGLAVHYFFGTMNGAIYGALSRSPKARLGFGSIYGTALWAIGDEIAVPLFGFSKPALEYPWTTHASALASHIVYGVTAEGVRRGVRALLN